jgi:hypothetical protein
MSQFALVVSRPHSLGGSKGALYRETLQATGFYGGRIVIASAEFAPMPPSVPGYPGGPRSDGHRLRFLRHGGIFHPMWGALKNPNPSRTSPPANARFEPEKRAGRIALPPIVLMSSGRLFLDRVGRHQSPSPLRRQTQHIFIAGPKETIYHRTANSVLTGCLRFRDRRNFFRTLIGLKSEESKVAIRRV